MLDNAKINHDVYGMLYEKKGHTYLEILDYKVSIEPEDISYQFNNLFNGDQALGNEMNKVLNENKFDVYRDVREGYETAFAIIFKDVTNRLFAKVYFSDIFPE